VKKQTDTQTNGSINHTPATVVGMVTKTDLHCQNTTPHRIYRIFYNFI